MQATLRFVLRFVNVDAVLAIVEEWVMSTALPKVRGAVQDWVARIALASFNNDPAAVSAAISSCAAKGK